MNGLGTESDLTVVGFEEPPPFTLFNIINFIQPPQSEPYRSNRHSRACFHGRYPLLHILQNWVFPISVISIAWTVQAGTESGWL